MGEDQSGWSEKIGAFTSCYGKSPVIKNVGLT
jgi:hypothetical protein